MLTRQSKRKLDSQVIGNELDHLHSVENGGAFGKKGRKKSLHGRAIVEDNQEHGDTARLQLIEKLRRKWPDALAPRCRLIGSLHSPEKGSTSHEEEADEEEEQEGEEGEEESNEHGFILSKGVDEKGYLIVCPHYMLTSRYRITRVIGKGTFAKVVECFDVETKRDVAVKIVRNTSKYTMAAMNEIIVIMTMMQYDPMGLFDFVRLGHWFHYSRGGHVTMVFPKLGKSLYETMERNDNPFPVYMIRKYLKSLLQTLAYMHSLGIVHTDVKPENVLHDDVEYEVIKSEHPGLASEFPTSDRLTLIDFGSAQLKERSHPKLVSTRHYRAPEVLLGLSWSSSIDVWSVGCLLLELVMGDTFFYNQDYNASPETKDLEHLGMIERAVGTIPRVLVEQSVQAEKGKYFFRENGTLRYPNSSTSEKSRRAYWETMKLEGYFCSDVNPSLRADGKETRDLLDLARRMLHWLPEKRCTFRSISTEITKRIFNTRTMYQLRKSFGILLLTVVLMAGTIAAQNAVDDVKNAADTVGSGAKEVGESIASGATSAGEAIASGATSAGEAIASGVTSAAEAVGNAAQDAFTSFAWAPSHLISTLIMLCAAFMF